MNSKATVGKLSLRPMMTACSLMFTNSNSNYYYYYYYAFEISCPAEN